MDSPHPRVGAGVEALSMLELHHTGARSSTERVTPLAYWRVSDTSVAVLASNFGAARHPAWYHNLNAHPAAVIDIGGERWAVNARVAASEERARLIERIASESAAVAAAIGRTPRQIPVVILELVERLDWSNP